MLQKGTRGRMGRVARRGCAVVLAGTALWLVWATGNPLSALEELKALATNGEVAAALMRAELGDWEESNLSPWDRLILAQSSLLDGAEAAQATPSATPQSTPEPTPTPQTEDEGEGEVELPVTTTAPEGIIPQTMVAGNSAKYATFGQVSIYNHTDYALDVEGLLAAAPALAPAEEGPDILIYHSHATEAYTMDGSDIYEESDSYRTLDNEYNMVRIGEEMKAIFEAAGLEVVHDTTLYDYPNYNDSYTRSAQGVKELLAQYPSVRLVLDVHRDALVASDGTIYKTVAGTVDNCAQVMMVMGTDAGGAAHPNWRVNLSLAASIQQALTAKWATLARPVVLRTSSFNQQQSTASVLLEVGTHGNTLQEAITAARLYARTVAEMFNQG